jgi:hypothetical protein
MEASPHAASQHIPWQPCGEAGEFGGQLASAVVDVGDGAATRRCCEAKAVRGCVQFALVEPNVNIRRDETVGSGGIAFMAGAEQTIGDVLALAHGIKVVACAV